ncbi:MAG TPA: glycosyltransferase family 2 protein [Alphaproteobacteria bacterium]|nr:glycosyltransferase family 2 protein [Alphaproteobacteria bacterium]
MIKISAYIVTLNEEARLDRTLKAVSKIADEIIVVDSGSTDKTKEIALKNKAQFIFHKWKNISSQKNFAQNKCKNDWVISLDSDEVLSDDLIAEIKEIKKNPTADAYKVKICDILPGDKKPRLLAKTYNQVRLYNRKKANMPDDLTHDRVVLGDNCSVLQLKSKIWHYSYVSLTQLWFKLNMYTDELVQVALKKNKKYSKLRLYTEMPRQFLFYYFIRRYCMYGTCGFWMATSYAYFRFLKIAKWFEWQALHKK